jgi:hypothetical protein
MLKFIIQLILSGFKSHTGYTLATSLTYYEGKPQIGFVLRKHHVFFWIKSWSPEMNFLTQQEANDYIRANGIILDNIKIRKKI